MLFLKKFYAYGFKSFANKTTLNFDSNLIGVVGPNGAGKSNVVDAIKWVLGEQSIKSLRGKKTDDIIFHGSKSKEANDYAIVTLYFDNSNKHLHYDGDEVAVSRKVTRGNGNNEYFINDTPARLKDIHDIFADTGLAKGSLGIISQGTVNWFADSKPEERRKIFEEASGISKYTRKKQETLRQLERTQQNLNRVSDIYKELAKEVKRLESQAEKVKQYQSKKQELAALEISCFKNDLIFFDKELKRIDEIITKAESDKQTASPEIELAINKLKNYKENLANKDAMIYKWQTELNNINDKINELKIQKSVFDNNIELDLNSSNVDTQQNAFANKLNMLETDYANKQKAYEDLKISHEKAETLYQELIASKNELTNNINENEKNLIRYKTQYDYLVANLMNNENYKEATKVILANKTVLTGILGTVSDFIKTEERFELAIYKALGRNIENLVVNTNRDVKRAIEFLIKNQAGTASFMPIYDLKPKTMKQEHVVILNEIEGFLGLGVDLIQVEKKIRPVFETLLGRIIICTDFDAATKIAQFTYHLYRIITLDGQEIKPAGIVVGGYNKSKEVFTNTLKKKIKLFEKAIGEIEANLETWKTKLSEVELQLINTNNDLTEKKANLFIYSSLVKEKENELINLKAQYKQFDNLTKDKNTLIQDLQTLNQTINRLEETKNKVLTQLKTDENIRRETKNEIVDLEERIEQLQGMINNSQTTLVELKAKQVDYQKNYEHVVNSLRENYQLTVEYVLTTFEEIKDLNKQNALNRIERLKKDLHFLGPLNMQAQDELSEKGERVLKLKSEYEEITNAKNALLEVINELDQKANTDFTNTITNINNDLNPIFQELFGGGECYISYSDENDVLNSGIEILANPPGKKVNNLFALSGGEKTLVALSVLFAILKSSNFPLVILDEAESALDPANVERFGNMISFYAKNSQFLVITHRPGTMEKCDKLYGVTMQQQGITSIFQVKVQDAKKYTNQDNKEEAAEQNPS